MISLRKNEAPLKRMRLQTFELDLFSVAFSSRDTHLNPTLFQLHIEQQQTFAIVQLSRSHYTFKCVFCKEQIQIYL